MGTPFKYEYQCISQNDENVAEGEFILQLPYTIRSPHIRTEGMFGMMRHAQDKLSNYKGQNHLKKVKMKVTNMITKSVRYF